jgi:hypothetical protein
MSHISKIQRPDSSDYLSRLAAQTRRDDVELVARHGGCRPSDADSTALLAALFQRWPDGHFDETNIAVSAPRSPRLLAALGFLNPRVRRVAHNPMLSGQTERDLLRWMLTIRGRDIGGLRLDRDPIGWCSVSVVGRAQ